MSTAKSIIKSALRELRIFAAGEEPEAEDYTDALELLNDIVEVWQTDERAFYSENDVAFTITTGTGQYAVGDATVSITSITRSGTTATATCATKHGLETGNKATVAGAAQTDYNITAVVTVTSPFIFTYTVANSPATPATGTLTFTNGNFSTPRPVELLNAFFRASGSDTPLAPVTERYMDAIPAKSTTAATPSKILYRPGFPFGQILMYPVPSSAGVLHVKTRNALGSFATIDTEQSMPPGYKRGLALALALSAAPQYGHKVTQETILSITTMFKALWTLNTGAADKPPPKTVVIQAATPPVVAQ